MAHSLNNSGWVSHSPASLLPVAAAVSTVRSDTQLKTRKGRKADEHFELGRWLIANGHQQQAEHLLAHYHTDGDISHPLIQFEMTEIGRTIEMEHTASEMRWSALVKTPGNRKRTFIAVCVGAFAQWNVSKYFLSSKYSRNN